MTVRLRRLLLIGTQSIGGIGLGLALCWFLAAHLDLDATKAAALLATPNWFAILGVLLLSWLLLEAGARKWSCLDRRHDHRQPQPHGYYLGHMAWQTWLAQILPTAATLILGRALVTQVATERNWRRGFKSALIDQLSELFIILAFIPASLWQLSQDIPFALWLGTGLITTIAATQIGIKLWPKYVLLDVVLWSAVRVALITLRLVLGAAAFSLPLAAASVAYATPLATLAVLIPLTPGNLGISEWSWTYTLTLWHEDPATAALYALGFRVLIFLTQTLLLPLAWCCRSLRAR